jgi:hypothetical protein
MMPYGSLLLREAAIGDLGPPGAGSAAQRCAIHRQRPRERTLGRAVSSWLGMGIVIVLLFVLAK